VPVIKGKIPKELLTSIMAVSSKRSQRPDKVLRKLFDTGQIRQEGNMQLITTVTKNIESEDTHKLQNIAHHMEVPSLLHVLDKSDLTKHIIKKDKEDERNEGYLSRILAMGKCKYKQEAQVEKDLRYIFKQ